MIQEGQYESSKRRLEDEIREHLLQIVDGHTLYRPSIVRAGYYRKNPVQIHTPPVPFLHPTCQHTPDALAHRLTLEATEEGKSLTALEHIVLIPRWNATGHYFLTHLFLPDRKILAVYLYPGRLEESTRLLLPRRLTGQFPVPSSPGLTIRVLQELRRLSVERNEEEKDSTPLRFTLPLTILTGEELQTLDELDTGLNRLCNDEC